MDYIEGRPPGEPPRGETDLRTAIGAPTALGAAVVLLAGLIGDSQTDDSPWTAPDATVWISAAALLIAAALSFYVARHDGASRALALFAAAVVLLAVPAAVLAGYVALSIAGA